MAPPQHPYINQLQYVLSVGPSHSTDYGNKGIAILPALLETSTLALLSASIPLRMTLTLVSVAIDYQGKLLPDLSTRHMPQAASVHALGFSATGDMIMAESEGKFLIDTWEQVFEMAKSLTSSDENASNVAAADTSVSSAQASLVGGTSKIAIQQEISKQQRWKGGGD